MNTAYSRVTVPGLAGYVTYMLSRPDRVQVFERHGVLAIVAAEGWTDEDWDAAVPASVADSPIDSFNYRIVEGYEVWTIDVKEKV